MTEIWLPIEGYDFYEVSNLGRVRRLESVVTNKNGVTQKFPGKILKPGANKGYLFVVLCKNGISRSFLLHRLVASAFIPNPENLPCVNHRDENKQNNSVENLEWCTVKYNVNYGTGIQRSHEKCSKPVLCVELNQIFPSVREAARHFNVAQSNLRSVLAGRRKTVCGYHWKYAETKTAS